MKKRLPKEFLEKEILLNSKNKKTTENDIVPLDLSKEVLSGKKKVIAYLPNNSKKV